MRFTYLVIALLLIYANAALAQQTLVKGNVLDSKNNSKLSGVTVKVGEQATRTDRNGYFEMAVPLKTATERGISFSHVGYLNVNLIYQPNHIYQVTLTEKSTELREVLIAPGDDIIKKAIKKIPENYPDKPTVIKGIQRIQKWRNNSQYFKSDAIVKAYIPPYTSQEKTTVTVLSNQLDTVYDKTLKYIKNIGNYNLIEFADIAHNKDVLKKLLKKRKLDYRLVGKQMYNNHKVFVINSMLKDTTQKYKRLEVTLYIDTASYAFVAANLAYYDIPRIGPFIARKELNQRVVYEKVGNKWYLAEVHSKNIAAYKNEEPHSVTDFIRTDLDTNTAERIAYKDRVQKMDDVLLIERGNMKELAKYSDIFDRAELAGKLQPVPSEKLDTIKKNNLAASVNYKKPFGRKVYDYIRGDNNRFSYGLNKLPINVSSSSIQVPTSVGYGLGMSSYYRVYGNWFLGFEITSSVLRRNEIGTGSFALNLSREVTLNENGRPIVLTPQFGYQAIFVSYKKLEKSYHSINLGMRASYELSRTKAFFLTYSRIPKLKTTDLSVLTLNPRVSAFGLGIVFKK